MDRPTSKGKQNYFKCPELTFLVPNETLERLIAKLRARCVSGRPVSLAPNILNVVMEVALLDLISKLQLAGVTSNAKLVAEIRSLHPDWNIGSREIRQALKQHAVGDAGKVGVSPAFDVVLIEGKGFGVVAARNIVEGEQLIAESPLLRVPPSDDGDPVLRNIELAAKAMSGVDKAQFFSLSQYNERFGDDKSLEGVWMTNALPIDHGFAGVFAETSRINHGCNPNAHTCWNATLQMQTVYAITPIAQGSEIVICYFREGPRAERQHHLKREFGFDCSCAMCGLTGKALQTSDARQQRIHDLDDEILRSSQAGARVKQVDRLIDERIRLMKEEGFACARAKRSMVDGVQVVQVVRVVRVVQAVQVVIC